MIPNYSAQDFALLTDDQKETIKAELKSQHRTYADWLVEIKKNWPKEVHLPRAKWGKRR